MPTISAARFGFLLLLVSGANVPAQQAAPSSIGRKTIGVALEGGGAKGLAHIGALQWLEEHQIPVDFIAGTSMGGLIGGLYATGLRPSELRELVSGIDWDQVLAGQTPYPALSFRRKEDLRAFPNRLEIGLRGGVGMPGGLTSGQSVRVLIDRYLLPYSQPKSFDELPIPFRCVATDLVSGKPAVFSNGSIASALRATMSIPGVFAPVKDGEKIYADGGMVNNLPTDVVKQMGADVVLGIHLNIGPTDPKKLRSLFEVAGGATGVMIDANVLRNMELADLLMTVDVAGYTTLDFSRANDIIEKGYEAAQSKANLLESFRLSEEDWKRYLARRESRRVAVSPIIEFVEVKGIDAHLADEVRRRLGSYVGTKVDTTRLESDLTTLIGVGRFDTLAYSLTERDGRIGLEIKAEEKDYSPPWLKPGSVIDGSDPDNVGFTFASRITFLDVGSFRSELRIDMSFGSKYQIRSEYYHPFTPLSRWFVAPRAGAERVPFNLYVKSDRVAEYRINTMYGGVDVGYNFDRFSELRFGYQGGYASTNLRIGSPVAPSASGRVGATQLRFAMDHLDNPIIPRRGTAVLTTMSWVDANPGSRTAFPSGETTIIGLKQISKPGSVYGVAAGGTTFGGNDDGFPQFALGGASRLAAYGLNEFLTNQYVYGRAGYIHRLGVLPPLLGAGIYFNAHYEMAKTYGPGSPGTLPRDVAIGVIAETLFGPLLLGGSFGDNSHRKWFFQLGKIF